MVIGMGVQTCAMYVMMSQKDGVNGKLRLLIGRNLSLSDFDEIWNLWVLRDSDFNDTT